MQSPAFLLNAPFSLATDTPNNATMRKLSHEARRVDRERAMAQWTQLYRFLSQHGLVYLLPSQSGLQDQVFVANLGIVLTHTPHPAAVIANFRSEPRRDESPVGVGFFRSMGFETVVPPHFFEGEADLKFLREDIYVGGYGLRTSREALDWMRDHFEMRIVPIRTHDEHLYHLDCVIFPLSPHTVLACTAALSQDEVHSLEAVAELIDVPLPIAHRGLTNAVRLGPYYLCDSNLHSLSDTDPLYATERAKVKLLEHICSTEELQPVIFDLSEFYKSGAMLSCMVMHLNYPSLRSPEPQDPQR